jgi:3-deoxy-D-manno-octulosonic-acid transferase
MRSATGGAPPAGPEDLDARLLALATTGELAATYRYADIALVCGSFHPERGGQNFIEALAAGAPCMVGPHTRNFAGEVEEATAAQALLQAPDDLEASRFADQIADILANESQRKSLAENGKNLIRRKRGAIERTINVLIRSGIFSESEIA